jgi:hypothetical protein
MPRIVYGSQPVKQRPDWNTTNFDYSYPNGLNLKPGTEVHDDVVKRIMERADESYSIVSGRHGSWNEIDRVLTAYAVVDENEEKILDEDERKPVTIIFPYSYAILETLISYLMSAFIQNPVFRYEGTAPEDTIGAILMEKVVEHNVWRNKVALSLHTMFRDSLSYGFGVGAPYWYSEQGQKIRKVPQYNPFLQWMGIEKVTGYDRVLENVTIYEGNALSTIDPYLCLPDPNVPIHAVQSGEYFGWIDSSNIYDLLSDEQVDSDLFNVKYLKQIQNRATSLTTAEGADARDEKSSRPGRLRESSITTKTDIVKMFVKLIPKEWKLGDSENPEKWEFAVGADEVLIKAKPLGLNHNRFPVAISAPDYDGYSSTPISRLEILYGMQHIVDFLFNSHITNVRKAINDMFIVDPYIVNVDDLKNPKPGKIIRTRRPVWGKGVKDAVQQFAVNDITRNNISDVTFIVEYMHRISSVDDAAMGNLRSGGPERLTGSEFEGTRAGMVSRMERIAKVIGLQAMQDIGYFFASHTQQLMQKETYVNITGEWFDRLVEEYGTKDPQLTRHGKLKVSPEDILIDYDVIVRDGSVPGGNFSKVWMEMFKVMAQYPELQQSFDIVRIFNHIARNSGAKNVSEFRKVNVATMPDEAVAKAAQAGQIIPMPTKPMQMSGM